VCAGGAADNIKTKLVPLSAPRMEPVYTVRAGLDGEIFPVFANYASLQSPPERTSGTVVVRIANNTDAPLRNRVTVKVRGWSDEEIQTTEMPAGESRTLLFAPAFLPRLYDNHEIVPATALVTATDLAGRVVFTTTAPVRIRSVDDMYWGPEFKDARFIASWVTPHDPGVEEVLAKAKEFMPGRRLPGYESWKSPAEQKESTQQQVRAIYRALQEKGVSYVKSSITFGNHTGVSERVRMPYESLRQVSANCIDAAVVLVPGHAYVGVRASQSGDQFLYLDTALTGRATFEVASQAAEQGLARQKAKDIMRIQVPDARNAGIYPMPGPETESGVKAVMAARTDR
jgi:hypothetical protein